MNLDELVVLAIEGDKRAFRKLLAQLQKEVLRYVQIKVKNQEDAEEIVQDVLLSLTEALPLYAERSNIKTFVMGIARHEVADYWRKKYAKKVIRMVPLVRDLYDRKLFSAEQTQRVMYKEAERIYRKLSVMHERVLRMKYEEELSVAEMAKRLKITPRAVEALLYRARKAFQKLYVEEVGKPNFSVVGNEKR